MPPFDIAHARLRAQRLVGPPLISTMEVVGWLGAVITSPHLIAVDGLVVGDWRRVLRSREAEIHPRLPLPVDQSVLAGIDAEAERMSRFLGTPVSVRRQAPTHPPAQAPDP